MWSLRGPALIDDPTLGFIFEGYGEVAGTEAYDLVCFPGKEQV